MNEVILKCEKVIVHGEIFVPVCILGDPANPLLPFVMKEYPKGGKDDHEKFFGYKLSSAKIVIENAFGRLKGRFRYLNRAMDVNVKELPNFIMSCFVLHNFCEFRKEKLPKRLFTKRLFTKRKGRGQNLATRLPKNEVWKRWE